MVNSWRTMGTPEVAISNTFLPILRKLQETFGGSIRRKSDARGNRRTSWEWRLFGKNAKSFLRLVLPYLIEKQEQARLVLHAFSIEKHRRMDMFKKIKSLKKVDYGFMENK